MAKKRKAVSAAHANIVELTNALAQNGRAMREGPKRKHWTRHDLKQIQPLTPAQETMFREFFDGQHVFAHGSAGTGKTYLSIYLALNEFFRVESEYEHIIIVRSAVPTRDVGFLPGTLEEKNAVYEMAYRDIFADLIGRQSTYDDMKEAGMVQFVSTSFVRGLTWDHALVIFDEVQNCTEQEIHSVMTRIGQGSRVIVCGDKQQNDLHGKKGTMASGTAMILALAETMSSVSVVDFKWEDCVRSGFAREWLHAVEHYKPND